MNSIRQKHLGATIGSREYLDEYVSEKVTNSIYDIAKLAEFVLSQPRANGSNLLELLEPLENAISHMLMVNPSLEATGANILRLSK